MNNPRVSVCVPTYNRAATVARTIEAILSQTFADWELIISDDGSTDKTQEVVNRYNDPRIRRYRNKSNIGLYENWHRCMDLARGEFIAIYHDHDIYLPSILTESVATMDLCPTATFVHTAWFGINCEGRIVSLDRRKFPQLMKGKDMVKLLAHSWCSPVMAPTALVRAEAYKQAGKYRYEEYGLGCDLDMWLRLAQLGDVAYISRPQAFMTERVQGQFTNRFSWSHCIADVRMHREHIDSVEGGNPIRHKYWRLRFALCRDQYLFSRGIRALMLEDTPVKECGLQVIESNCFYFTREIYRCAHKSKFLQKGLRRLALPVHYWRVKKTKQSYFKTANSYLEAGQPNQPNLPDLALRQLMPR